MADMTDEEFTMYQRYGPNYRSRMRFGQGARTARSRHQFNPGGSFYHTDPDRTIQRVESIMGAPPPAKNSPYLSDYLEQYEATRKRVLQLEELMYQNQFQNPYQDISFEDFYNNYYGDYGSGYQDVASQEQIQPNPLYAPEITDVLSNNEEPVIPFIEPKTKTKTTLSDSAITSAARTAVANFMAAQNQQNNTFALQQAQSAPSFTGRLEDMRTAPATTQRVTPSTPVLGRASQPAVVAPSLNQFIPRYDRDESSPVAAPAPNMVRPTGPVAAPSKAPVKAPVKSYKPVKRI